MNLVLIMPNALCDKLFQLPLSGPESIPFTRRSRQCPAGHRCFGIVRHLDDHARIIGPGSLRRVQGFQFRLTKFGSAKLGFQLLVEKLLNFLGHLLFSAITQLYRQMEIVLLAMPRQFDREFGPASLRFPQFDVGSRGNQPAFGAENASDRERSDSL